MSQERIRGAGLRCELPRSKAEEHARIRFLHHTSQLHPPFTRWLRDRVLPLYNALFSSKRSWRPRTILWPDDADAPISIEERTFLNALEAWATEFHCCLDWILAVAIDSVEMWRLNPSVCERTELFYIPTAMYRHRFVYRLHEEFHGTVDTLDAFDRRLKKNFLALRKDFKQQILGSRPDLESLMPIFVQAKVLGMSSREIARLNKPEEFDEASANVRRAVRTVSKLMRWTTSANRHSC